MRVAPIIPYLLLALSVASNSKPPQQQGRMQFESYRQDPNAVGVRIEPFRDSECTVGGSCYVATYAWQGSVAKFRIEFDPLSKKNNNQFVTAIGKGRIISVAGSDSTLLLQHLKKALEAKSIPNHATRSSQIEFDYVTLGDHMSQAPEGGFNAEPPGNWAPNKLFLAGGEGEVFFNINPVMKMAEFSIKDPDYGDIVLRELAKVL
jgi:hypothetical protein